MPGGQPVVGILRFSLKMPFKRIRDYASFSWFNLGVREQKMIENRCSIRKKSVNAVSCLDDCSIKNVERDLIKYPNRGEGKGSSNSKRWPRRKKLTKYARETNGTQERNKRASFTDMLTHTRTISLSHTHIRTRTFTNTHAHKFGRL